MSDIGGVGHFGNDPFLSALQKQQQAIALLQQQQRCTTLLRIVNVRQRRLRTIWALAIAKVKVSKENFRRSAR